MSGTQRPRYDDVATRARKHGFPPTQPATAHAPAVEGECPGPIISRGCVLGRQCHRQAETRRLASREEGPICHLSSADVFGRTCGSLPQLLHSDRSPGPAWPSFSEPVGATLVRERKLAIHGGAESHSGGLPMLLVMTRNIANTPINWAKKESKTRTRMKCHAFCSGGLSFLERTAQILQVAPACSRVHQERGKSATNAQAQLKSKARRGRALTTLQP